MITTLSTALSALNANSTAVAVVGNDLANLNTTGYKTTEIAFQDLMSETMGGVNGFSLGMGTARPQTIRQFSQGGLQTGLGGLNAAIHGQGFFMVADGKGNTLYTRDGTFTTGSNGYLVNANGLRVQGWTTGTNGVLNVNSAIGDIPIPSGTLFPPVASSRVTLSLNLNSAAVAGTNSGVTSGIFSQPITVYDSLGNEHTLTATFTKQSNPAEPVVVGTAQAQLIAPTDTATFYLQTASGAHTITITGQEGDTLDGQMAKLNTQLQAYGVTASQDSNQFLQFTSGNAFTVNAVAGNAQNLVDTGTGDFAKNDGLNDLLITPGGPGHLKITVGTTVVTAPLAGGASPTEADVVAINNALLAQGVTGVSAVLDQETSVAGTPPTYTAVRLMGTSDFTVADDFINPGTYVAELPPDKATVSGTPLVSNSWNYAVTMQGSDLASGVNTTVASGVLSFDANTGQLVAPALANGEITLTTSSGKNDTAGALANGAVMNDITWALYDDKKNPLLTQVNQASAVSANTADGSAAAQLTEVIMGDGGQLMAQFSNGKSVAIAQLSIANIPNPNSMLAIGNNDFEASTQTAAPIVGTAGTGGRGTVNGGALEQSTVDIATEFSQLITFQNAYQANSRVITTENQILQQTVSLVQP